MSESDIMYTLNLYFFSQQFRLFLGSCQAHNTKLRKTAGKEGQSCSSCFNTYSRWQEYKR